MKCYTNIGYIVWKGVKSNIDKVQGIIIRLRKGEKLEKSKHDLIAMLEELLGKDELKITAEMAIIFFFKLLLKMVKYWLFYKAKILAERIFNCKIN